MELCFTRSRSLLCLLHNHKVPGPTPLCIENEPRSELDTEKHTHTPSRRQKQRGEGKRLSPEGLPLIKIARRGYAINPRRGITTQPTPFPPALSPPPAEQLSDIVLKGIRTSRRTVAFGWGGNARDFRFCHLVCGRIFWTTDWRSRSTPH